MRRLLRPLSLLATTLYLTGCGFTVDKIANITPTGAGTHGKVIGGQAPVIGATVSVYAVGVGTPAILLATTTTDAAGNFAFGGFGTSYTCGPVPTVSAQASPQQAPAIHPRATPSQSSSIAIGGGPSGTLHAQPAALPVSTDTYVYITAKGGDSGGGPNSRIALGAALGRCADAQNEVVQINEVSTVILANVMGNFSDFTGNMNFTISTDPHQVTAMQIADSNTFQTLDDLATGTVNPNTVSTSGGTSIKVEAAKIYSLANIIASCVNSADDMSTTPATPSSACTNLFSHTQLFGVPFDTFSAALGMAYNPTLNTTYLYQLAGSKPPFVGLTTAPHDLSVGVSYSTSTMGLTIYTSAINQGSHSTIDLDSNSRVWFPSNKTGGIGLGYFDPTDNTFNGPYNRTDSHALTVPQYVALDDTSQIAWVTDTQSQNIVGFSTSPGSEGALAYNFYFYDTTPGTSPYGLGPLFVNADSSITLNYDDSFGIPNAFTFNTSPAITATSTFTLQPTGFTLNTTQGVDPNDPASPLVVAPTSDFASTCNLETSSANNGNVALVGQNNTDCLTGGVATTAFFASKAVQDQVAAFTSGNAYCSEINKSCTTLANLSTPEGVAVDGGNEVWFANRGTNSVYPLQGNYSAAGKPSYTAITQGILRHGAAYGGTMTSPMGIAVDRTGNIWVSNDNCADSSDTTCVYTLSEVFAVAYNTLTPLSLQADRLQGTQPLLGPAPAASGSPTPMLRKRPVTD